MKSRGGLYERVSELEKLPLTKEILDSDPHAQVEFIRQTFAAFARMRDKLGKPERWSGKYFNLWHQEGHPSALMHVSMKLFRRKLPFTPEDVLYLTERLAYLEVVTTGHAVPVVEPLVTLLERHCEKVGLSNSLRKAVVGLDKALDWSKSRPEQRLRERLALILKAKGPLREGTPKVILEPGEAWSDQALKDLKEGKEKVRDAWLRLLAHCQTAQSAAPSKEWLSKATDLRKAVGEAQFKGKVINWFAKVDEPRTRVIDQWEQDYQPDPNQLIIEPHALLLRGLAWITGLREDKDMARALRGLAMSAYRKVPKIGPRAVKVGNAAVTALGLMPGMEGVYQLALLKVKVKFGTAQKVIEKALNATAERVGIPRDELEEMAVPSYGLSSVGVAEEKMGDYTARLCIKGTSETELTWLKADGKVQRSVPASVKESYKEDLKELQAAAKDIQRMLPAQRERIDSLFLQQRCWPLEVWKERYLDHPLVRVLARRLLWEFTTGERSATGIWFGDQLVDLDLKVIERLGASTKVQLWHPIGKDVDEVKGWREWLDAQQIQQPFKQAHREIYVLTDAERRTNTYSNRYAAHILKQHQFNALCALRGWKNQLRLMVDAEYLPPTLYLPKWGLRAEFWVETVGDDYGRDTNESGVYLYLSTDQVRFYELDAAQRSAHASGGGYQPGWRQDPAQPLPLDQIPALVFSEVMRDVDMFVGVASVGNDPAWSDGGPEGRYRNYWHSYSFGELNASGKTRKEVLERLIPRLKIAPQCSFEEKFLVVKGSLRTYKIHLGSGNILMSPNDQYLCIVPKQGVADDGKLLLPFEGDRTLSVIISKAILLAADEKITDASIVSQIGKRPNKT